MHRKNKLVIVFTGTVASSLAEKIIRSFKKDYFISGVFTEASKYFTNIKDSKYVTNIDLSILSGINKDDNAFLYDDTTEWYRKESGGIYHKDDIIPHIKLATDNDALLIIASADFMAKMANGQCDDLASSLYRAWHRNRPIVIAPAMNTHMWTHPITQKHIKTLKEWGCYFVDPIAKKLACGDIGIGALAKIEDIKSVVDDKLTNIFPLMTYNGLPVGNHPGAYMTSRKHAPHTGVDLYTIDRQPVLAMHDGEIISVEDFTGKFDKSTWWEDTKCVLIRHWFGVVCYGEIDNSVGGGWVRKGQCIGRVKRVLKKGKERPDIPGHSLSMLHVELYPEGQERASRTYELDKDILRDPTPFLENAVGFNGKMLVGEST